LQQCDRIKGDFSARLHPCGRVPTDTVPSFSTGKLSLTESPGCKQFRLKVVMVVVDKHLGQWARDWHGRESKFFYESFQVSETKIKGVRQCHCYIILSQHEYIYHNNRERLPLGLSTNKRGTKG
jgi:hypothetical protein